METDKKAIYVYSDRSHRPPELVGILHTDNIRGNELCSLGQMRKIYNDGELTDTATCKQSLQVQIEGSRSVKRNVKYYNLDMILAIGYRVRSHN